MCPRSQSSPRSLVQNSCPKLCGVQLIGPGSQLFVGLVCGSPMKLLARIICDHLDPSPRSLVFKILQGPRRKFPNQLVLNPDQGAVTGCWVWERGLCWSRNEDRQEFEIFIFGSKCPPATATTITAITTTIFFFTDITFTTYKQHSPLKRRKETKKELRCCE